MTQRNSDRDLVDGPGGEASAGIDPRVWLRSAHIFSTAIRGVLENKLLREVSPCPLTPSQFHLLKLMSLDGRHHVGEVADLLGVSAPAATKNIDKLEGLGLVVRTRSSGDRRATLLSVSPEGRRLVEDYERLMTVRLSPVLGRFEAEEIARFRDLLERFAVSLLEHEPPEEDYCLLCAAYLEADCPVGRVRGGCPYQKLQAAAAGRQAPDAAG